MVIMEQLTDRYQTKMQQPSNALQPYSALDSAFGIEGSEKIIEPPREYPVVDSRDYPVTVKERDDDIATIRTTLHRILQKAENSLDDLAIVAKQSESPRSYEVVATMINTVTDIAGKLIDLHEKKSKMDGGGKSGMPTTANVEVQNNIVFTGSSTELMKAITANRERSIN